MGLSHMVINFDCLQGRGFGFRDRFARGKPTEARGQVVGIGQPRVSQGVVGVFFDGLLEVFDRLLCSFLGPLVPKKSAPQKELIRFGILRVAFGQQLLLLAGQTQPQLLGDVCGDVFLQSKDVGHLAAILAAP